MHGSEIDVITNFLSRRVCLVCVLVPLSTFA